MDIVLAAISLFEEKQIEYALIGGVAAMYYGQPRFTDNIDFLVAGLNASQIAVEAIAPAKILFDTNCAEIVDRAFETPLKGRICRMVEVHDLIAMKLGVGRLSDDADISKIWLNNTIDDSRLRTLISPEQFAHFESIKRRT